MVCPPNDLGNVVYKARRTDHETTNFRGLNQQINLRFFAREVLFEHLGVFTFQMIEIVNCLSARDAFLGHPFHEIDYCFLSAFFIRLLPRQTVDDPASEESEEGADDRGEKRLPEGPCRRTLNRNDYLISSILRQRDC